MSATASRAPLAGVGQGGEVLDFRLRRGRVLAELRRDAVNRLIQRSDTEVENLCLYADLGGERGCDLHDPIGMVRARLLGERVEIGKLLGTRRRSGVKFHSGADVQHTLGLCALQEDRACLVSGEYKILSIIARLRPWPRRGKHGGYHAKASHCSFDRFDRGASCWVFCPVRYSCRSRSQCTSSARAHRIALGRSLRFFLSRWNLDQGRGDAD